MGLVQVVVTDKKESRMNFVPASTGIFDVCSYDPTSIDEYVALERRLGVESALDPAIARDVVSDTAALFATLGLKSPPESGKSLAVVSRLCEDRMPHGRHYLLLMRLSALYEEVGFPYAAPLASVFEHVGFISEPENRDLLASPQDLAGGTVYVDLPKKLVTVTGNPLRQRTAGLEEQKYTAGGFVHPETEEPWYVVHDLLSRIGAARAVYRQPVGEEIATKSEIDASIAAAMPVLSGKRSCAKDNALELLHPAKPIAFNLRAIPTIRMKLWSNAYKLPAPWKIRDGASGKEYTF